MKTRTVLLAACAIPLTAFQQPDSKGRIDFELEEMKRDTLLVGSFPVSDLNPVHAYSRNRHHRLQGGHRLRGRNAKHCAGPSPRRTNQGDGQHAGLASGRQQAECHLCADTESLPPLPSQNGLFEPDNNGKNLQRGIPPHMASKGQFAGRLHPPASG